MDICSGSGSASDGSGLGQNERLVASSASASADSEIGHGIGENKGVAVELEIISDTSEGEGMRSAMRSAMLGYQHADAKDENNTKHKASKNLRIRVGAARGTIVVVPVGHGGG